MISSVYTVQCHCLTYRYHLVFYHAQGHLLRSRARNYRSQPNLPHFQGQDDDADGQAEEELLGEGRRAGELASVPLRRPPHQRRRDAQAAGNGTGRRHRGLPGADRRRRVGPGLRRTQKISFFF